MVPAASPEPQRDVTQIETRRPKATAIRDRSAAGPVDLQLRFDQTLLWIEPLRAAYQRIERQPVSRPPVTLALERRVLALGTRRVFEHPVLRGLWAFALSRPARALAVVSRQSRLALPT